MTNLEENDPDMGWLDLHVRQLGEHFDSVQIFVTRQTDDGESNTRVISRGGGNWYASFGAIHEWIKQQDARAFLEEKRRSNED